MLSRKLATALGGMVTIAAIVLVPGYLDVEVPLQVQLTGEILVAGLGGLNVMRQGAIDSLVAKNKPDAATMAAVSDLAKFAEVLGDKSG